MALFRGIQEYIALDGNNITLVFDSGNIVNISGNIFLYPPQGHPILYKYCPGNIKKILPSSQSAWNTRFYFGHQKLCMGNNKYYYPYRAFGGQNKIMYSTRFVTRRAILLFFDLGNIVNISGNTFLYPPQGHPILYFHIIHIELLVVKIKSCIPRAL